MLDFKIADHERGSFFDLRVERRFIEVDAIMYLVAAQVADPATRKPSRGKKRGHHQASLVDPEAGIDVQTFAEALDLL